jgi:hypothetical protein
MIHKNVKMISVLGLFILFASSYIGFQAIRPVAAAGAVDFVVTSDSDYEECAKALLLEATVRSPSGSMPTNVTASVNGTNYSLVVDYSQGNNISEGMVWKWAVCNVYLENTTLTIKYFASNASGQATSLVNDTIVIKSALEFDGNLGWESKSKIHTNLYRFSVEYSGCDIANISAVFTLNGTNYTAQYNNCYERFEYEHDFGIDGNGTFIYSFTLRKGDKWLKTANVSTTIDKVPQVMSISSFNVVPVSDAKENRTTNTYKVSVMIRNWNNTGPSQLILSVNGTNTTLDTSKTSLMDWEYKQNSMFRIGIDEECCKPVVKDWRIGITLGYYDLTVFNGSTYNITLFAFNGTKWINATLANNVTLNFNVYDYKDSNLVVDTLNSTIIIPNIGKSVKLYVNFTLNLTSQVAGFSNFYGSIKVRLLHPIWGSITITCDDVDWFDLNYTNGKLYRYVGSVGSSREVKNTTIKGDIQYYYELTYRIYTNSSQTWKSAVVTVDKTDFAAGEYGIKADQWYIFNTDYNYDCCCKYTGQYRVLYKIIGLGRFLGADYIDLKYYYWDECGKFWYNDYDLTKEMNTEFGFTVTEQANPFGIPNGVDERKFIDPDDPKTYAGSKFIPKGSLQKIFDYYIEQTTSGWFTLDTKKNTISSTHTFGCEETSQLIEYDKNGILVKSENTEKLGTCIISMSESLFADGKGNLPTDDGTKASKKIPGYDPILFIGFGLLGIAAIMLRLRRR